MRCENWDSRRTRLLRYTHRKALSHRLGRNAARPSARDQRRQTVRDAIKCAAGFAAPSEAPLMPRLVAANMIVEHVNNERDR